MPHVAIEIARPSSNSVTPPELEAALVEACTVAVRDGDCVLDSDGDEVPRTAVAIVRWGPGERSVRVEIGSSGGGAAQWKSRELNFSDADARPERWRTVGLTIATLAGEAARKESEKSAPAPSQLPPGDHGKKTETSRPSAEHADNRQPPSMHGPQFWVDLGGLVGSALDTASPRLGMWADVGVRIGRSPFFGVVGADYAVAEDSPSLSVQWLVFSAGLGAQLRPWESGFVLEGSASVSAERLNVSASDGARADSGVELGYGGRVRAAALWELGLISPVLAAEGWVNAAPVQIVVRDRYAGSVPQGGGMVLLGVRARIQ